MLKFICQKFRNEDGFSESILFIFGITFFLAIFYVLMMAYTPWITKANVNVATETLVREIEVHGAIDSEITQKANQLAELYDFEPEITYDATFIPATNHIQIRDDFTVTIKTTEDIVLLDGTLFSPVTLTIPIGSQRQGKSEKLWK